MGKSPFRKQSPEGRARSIENLAKIRPKFRDNSEQNIKPDAGVR
jgi:hypothetical protein